MIVIKTKKDLNDEVFFVCTPLGNKKKQSSDCFSSCWYPGGDLNPHAIADSRF